MFILMGALFAGNQILVNNITISFGATPVQMGYMVSALYGGSMIMVPFFGELAEHTGKRIAGAIVSIFVGTGALIVGFAPNVPVAVAGYIIYSAGFGGFESNMLALTSDCNGESASSVINLLQAGFSGGAVLSPLLIRLIIPEPQYRAAYLVITAIYAALAAYFFSARSIDAFVIRNESLRGIAIVHLLRDPVMLAFMVSMMVFVGMESTCTYWISGYFNWQGYTVFSGYALSLYWLSSIAGRIVASRMKSPNRLLVICLLTSSANALALIWLPGILWKSIAFLMMGICNGPLYGGLSLLGGTLYPENSAAAFALMIFSGAFGGMVFQPLISRFVGSGTHNAVFYMVSFALASVAVMLFFIFRYKASKESIS